VHPDDAAPLNVQAADDVSAAALARWFPSRLP
jgi:hypothetical protein